MQDFTQKYTIIQLLQYVEDGATFNSNEWPLHTTVADTFSIDWDVPTMVGKLTELLSHHDQARTVAMNDDFLGLDKQVRVTLLEKTTSLVRLHYDIIGLLEGGGAKFNDPQFARRGFRPHATVQKNMRLSEGDNVDLTALSIIDMFPNQEPRQRKILKTITIGS